ncbi:MAG: Gfo/Idh/MocA family oxidoreductase [Microlunatus sp.]|nr:Gfo/Idh/MocA family oxidoreductase [Microlunatus sp.]MDN5771857.1 Gfo/Idh/MocA family oxidoreductase [Microlunatus sp.]
MSFAHSHAASYARVLSRLSGVEVVAADPDHDRRPGETGGPALAADLGVDYVGDYPTLLARNPDAVIVCSENADHRRLVELAADAGVHVLCEKPIATTLTDADAMTAVCAAAGVQLMIAHPVRFAPAFATLRETVLSGSLGEVVSLVGTNNGRIPRGERAWFVDPIAAGGGALTDHLVHVLDLLDAVWPQARVRSVYAIANRLLHPESEVETAGLAALHLDLASTTSGGGPADRRLPVVIDASWSRPASYPTWGGLTLRVIGTGGISVCDPFAARVGGQLESMQNAAWIPYGPDLDALLLREFLAVAAGERPAAPDGVSGTRGLAVVLAAYESLRVGQPAAPRA